MDRSVILMLLICILTQTFEWASGQSFIGIGGKSRTTIDSNITTGSVETTVPLVAGNSSDLILYFRYSPSNVTYPGPYFYLEVVPHTNLTNNVSVTPWTKPCPRLALQASTPIAGFWCEFEFSLEGNLILRSGGANDVNGTELWNSNTAGLDVQQMGLVDTADEPRGNLVMYNSTGAAVWHNIANNPVGESFNCTDSPAVQTFLHGNRKLLHHIRGHNC